MLKASSEYFKLISNVNMIVLVKPYIKSKYFISNGLNNRAEYSHQL